MLQIDGVIYHIQQRGGISTYFDELIKFISIRSDQYIVSPGNRLESYIRFPTLERYRHVKSPPGVKVFHSSYYRCPSSDLIPMVTTVHDCIYEKFVKGPPLWIHSLQKSAAIDRSDVIVCVSESTKADLFRYYPQSEGKKVVTIPCAVSDEYFSIKREIEPNNTVLYVGARGGYKNFASLVFALKMMPHLNLLAVGGGKLNSTEIDLISNNIPSRFQHKPNVSNSELNALYNSSLCLAYPSAYEGFGIPILEAMKAGCPVIAVSTSSIPEVAGDAAILVESATSENIFSALKEIELKNVRDELVEKGFIQSSLYSWTASFEKLLKIYEDLGWSPHSLPGGL